VFFLALHGVIERGIEERQEPATQPAALVALLVGTDLDRDTGSVVGESPTIKRYRAGG
jgi:hypothetical protein